jgi:hypothetical protein
MNNFTFGLTNEVEENYVMRSFITFIPSNIIVMINTRRLRWAVSSMCMGRCKLQFYN